MVKNAIAFNSRIAESNSHIHYCECLLFLTDSGDFWIGLRKQGSTWYWMQDANTAERAMTNGHWARGMPDSGHTYNQCACLWRKEDTKVSWDDQPCSDEKHVICQKYL